MKLFIAAIFLSLSTLGWSNGNPAPAICSISGTVLEAGTTETLPGVRVSIAGTNIFTYSDRDGHFSFEGIAAGEVQLSFQLVSFEATQINYMPAPGAQNVLVLELISR